MHQAVNHHHLKVAGFPQPWCVAAGDVVRWHVSAVGPVDHARIVSLDGAALTAPWQLEQTLSEACPQSFSRGSWLEVTESLLHRFGEVTGCSIEVFLTQRFGRVAILQLGPLQLCSDDGDLSVTVGHLRLFGPVTLPTQSWLRINLSRRGDVCSLSVNGGDRLAPTHIHMQIAVPTPPWTGRFTLGWAGPGQPTANMRVARPRLQFSDFSLSWRFPTLWPESSRVMAMESDSVAMTAVNLPGFCVRSVRWDGSSLDPRLTPDHYDAVHLHEDDMGPCDWPASYTARVPQDASPGVYAIELAAGQVVERIPVFVRAAARRTSLLVVLPTASYLAYANESLPQTHFPWVGDDRGHRFAQDNGLLSLYDFHADLSGVTLTTSRKPMATLRDDYLYPLCGAPHLLPVDLRLLRLLRAEGIAFDLVTDHDLHRDGPDALTGYAAVATGSHPEYLSTRMEEALAGFIRDGGSLVYLGGNGFAAAVAFRGDLMELRRGPAEAGRTWDGPLAEMALALTNEPGGFLRHRGRGEFALTGGAISLMGFGPARPFQRTEKSRDPSVAWVFEGVTQDSFGENGAVLGGAAGYEVDATDPHLGTHPDTVILARADGFGDDFVADPTRWYAGGAAARHDRRAAEMTLRTLPTGGIIFSASSVAWCGALPEPGSMNDVGRITLNVIRRASAPTAVLQKRAPQLEGPSK